MTKSSWCGSWLSEPTALAMVTRSRGGTLGCGLGPHSIAAHECSWKPAETCWATGEKHSRSAVESAACAG